MVLQEIQAGLEVVRPGRELFVRQVRLGLPNSEATVRLVLVHGTCATEQQFHPLLEAMDRQIIILQQKGKNPRTISSIHCVLYDFVGCGQSPALDEWEAYDNAESIADLKAILDKFVVQQQDNKIPTVLLGHSYAPSIILRLLQQQQQPQNYCHGLILVSTAVRSEHLPQADHGHILMRLPVPILSCCFQSLMTAAFLKMAVHSQHTLLRETIRRQSNRNSMAVAQAYHRHMEWATTDHLRQACGCDNKNSLVPVLIVHGTDDGIVPVECAQHLANAIVLLDKNHNNMNTKNRSDDDDDQPLFDCRDHDDYYSPTKMLVLVEQASHLVMMEQPDVVASAVVDFLEQRIASTSSS